MSKIFKILAFLALCFMIYWLVIRKLPERATDGQQCEVLVETEEPGARVLYAKSCDAKDGMCPPPKWKDFGGVTPCSLKIERCIYHFKTQRFVAGELKDTGSIFFVNCTNKSQKVFIDEIELPTIGITITEIHIDD